MSIPIYLQPDAMDCGATCLRMIASYYGKDYSIDELRQKCYTTREGVSLLSISEAAEQIGFKTIAGKISYQTLIKEAPLPCIIHWNQNHFVVIYKVIKGIRPGKNREKILIADPAFGLIKFSSEEFKKHWISTVSNGEEKGIVLLLLPTNNFYSQKNQNNKPKNFRFLFSYFLQYKQYFIQLFMGLLLGSLLQLIFPFLTQSIVDKGINEKNLSFIYLVLLAQMMLIISRSTVDFIRRWILLHISIRVNLTLISDFFIKLMKLPMRYFDTKLMGDILQRIDDHARVEHLITSRSLEAIFSFFTTIIFSIVLALYNINIFLIFLTGSLLYTSWIFLFLKKRRELDYKFFESKVRSQNSTYQLISGMQEIKLQLCEKRKRWEWEDLQADLFKLQIKSLKLEQIRDAGNIFINESKNILITIMAATAVINNEMTLGMMLATQYIIGQLNVPIEQIIRFIHDAQDTKISLERINEIHVLDEEEKDKHQTKIIAKDIILKNVTFQYEGPHSKKVLDNVNLIIPEGKVTAIVGVSGSGKTTLIKLLLQYYAPTNGTILVGDKDLQTLHPRWWRMQCGAVMQDGFIFSESIARNIATSDEEIDKERLVYAATLANIHNFIMSLPLKYNTIIGNDGQNLSQGQKQRILIARAVYKNPDFLFFDEATNALDANNEKVIVDNLQPFYKNKTVVVVAHRLSTVKNADQIVVLDDGKIVEIGNHKQLIEKHGYYYELVKNQLELGN